MPVQPYIGFRPKEWVKSKQYVGYTAIWNLLDSAVLTMPVDVSDVVDDIEGPNDIRGRWEDHVPRNESDRFNWEQCESSPALLENIGMTGEGRRS